MAPAVAAATLAAPGPAVAAVTVRIQSKPKLKAATIKAGYLLTIPDSYSVAYDRSDGQEAGTQYFAGNFRTFETISISRTPLADLGLSQLEGTEGGDLGGLSPEEVVGKLLADTRDNQSTFGFKVLATARRAAAPQQQLQDEAAAAEEEAPQAGIGAPGPSGAFWDVEYVHQICRGIIVEESGGRRRCASVSGDRDLQVVSRHYVAAFTVHGRDVYMAKASAPTEAWPESAGQLLASVRSFALPPDGRAAA